MFERAIDLDSTFALAYAELAIEHTDMYWFYYDRTDERLGMAKAAVERARQLDPDVPEVHHALGNYYYHGELNYDRALEHYKIAQRSQPKNSDLYVSIASILRRQGKMKEAARDFLEVAKLDPRVHLPRYYLGETYMLLRKYDEALHQFDLAISLSPGAWGPYIYKSKSLLLRDGNTTSARIVVRDAERYVNREEDVAFWKAQLEMLDREYERALEQLSSESRRLRDGQFECLPLSQLYAEIYHGMKKPELAKASYDSAKVLVEAKLDDRPDDARYHSALGIAYAGLGRTEDARREGVLGVKLLPVSRDAWRGYRRVMDLAKIYVMTGEHDAAVDQLDELLSMPGELSAAMLKLDPTWDPIRDLPRFQRLLKMYSKDES